MMIRKTKQTVIAVLYGILFSSFSFWVYASFIRTPETCSDGLQNQNEEAIDCGGVCGFCKEKEVTSFDIRVDEAELVYAGPTTSDVVLKITNPNDKHGASSFSYTIFVKDMQGVVVDKRTDRGFILPKESKYMLQMGLNTNGAESKVEVTINDIEWVTFSSYKEKPVFDIYAKRYGPVASGVGFGQVNATLSNESGFDFQSLRVKVVLRDVSGKPIAVNQTEMNRVLASERRDIGPLVFPSYFPGDVSMVEIETEADMYNVDNFVKQHLPGGDFQRL